MRTQSVRRLVSLLGTVALLTAGPAWAQEDGKTFALVQINQQALFFNQMNEGAQAAADAAGVELVIFNANNDPAAQNSAIETYIQQGVDGLAVVAIDVNGIMPAVEQAAAAGIPVVAIDAILPGEGPHQAQVGVDNAAAGAELGQVSSTGLRLTVAPKSALSARSTPSSRTSAWRDSLVFWRVSRASPWLTP